MSELIITDALAKLVADYTDRTIDEAGVAELLRMCQSDPRVATLLAWNVYADLFLHAKYDQEKVFQTVYIDNDSEPFSFETDPHHWINEIHTAEHSPIPLNCARTDSETDKTFLQTLLFWSDALLTRKNTSARLRRVARIVSVGSAIAAGLFVAVVLLLSFLPHREAEPATPQELPDRVAVMSGELATVWAEDTPQIKCGQSVIGSTLALVSGMTRLTFNNDAEVLLSGPCHVRVDGPLALWCSRGTVAVHAPPSATGFVVNTPYARIVDRGTEFTVHVNDSELRVGVTQGLVEVCRDLEEPVRLSKGTAATATRDHVQNASFDDKNQLSFASFNEKMAQWYSKLVAEKETKSRERPRSPWLVAWYSAESRQGNSVPNKISGSNTAGNLALTAVQEEEGSLPGTHAIAFTNASGKKGVGRFRLPGSFESVTLVASVRINELQSQGNMIFASKQFGRALGGIYWQISRTGELYFCVTNENMENVSCQSKPLLDWKSCGGWYKFAVVADGEKKTVSHYIDGKRVAEIPWNDPVPITIGQGQLGFLSGKSFKQEDRTLGGALEEFKIFKRALSEDELALE
ncbi:MAG: LamG-like jellyroll fold domain-containing protein [Planctomycetia bacterium]|nr:LamG-like jellyroll fold domain-containing protein [Planctomycetia bacterium]